MPFDITQPYGIFATAGAWDGINVNAKLFFQGGAYYQTFAPYAEINPPDTAYSAPTGQLTADQVASVAASVPAAGAAIPASVMTTAQVAGVTGLSANQLTGLATVSPIFEGTWAALLSGYPAASYSGKRAVVTDATYFVNPIRLRSDGTKWRLDGDQTLWLDTVPTTGAAVGAGVEQLQKQWSAPAGFLTSLRWLALSRLDYKTATSDTYRLRYRIGAGSSPLTDTVLVTGATIQITTTNRTIEASPILIASSATQVRLLASQNGVARWPGTQTSTPYPQNTTIANSDAAVTVVSCTMEMTTGTDSTSSGQAHLFVSGG